MPQLLAMFVSPRILLLGGCCVGLAILVVVALSLVIAFLKKGEARDPTKSK
jgi:hypothetical protein